jgi:hypothetical protein
MLPLSLITVAVLAKPDECKERILWQDIPVRFAGYAGQNRKNYF